MNDLFVLGGAQSDFARKIAWDLGDPQWTLLCDTIAEIFDEARVGADAVDAVHVGDLVGLVASQRRRRVTLLGVGDDT